MRTAYSNLISRIGERRLNVVLTNLGVRLDQLGKTATSRKAKQDQLNSNARALNARLANHHCLIN